MLYRAAIGALALAACSSSGEDRPHKGGTSLAIATRDNRFGRDSSFSCAILKSTRTTLDSAGDVFDDNGAAVPVQTHD